MFSRFFIDRPIFATVVSLLIILAGFLSMMNLPIEQYPDLTPPTISVTATYPGASSEVLSDTVSSQLEQKINGVENMIYMTSAASSNGDSTTMVYFSIGTNPDQAMINVNNRVQMVLPKLPEEVRKYGINVQKKSPAILQVLSIYSDDLRYDSTFLGNYALVNIVDELKRIDGVGDAIIMGGNDYAMRIWLRPDKLAKLSLTTADIVAAISSQNAQRAAGKIGAPPMSVKVDKSYSIVAQGMYTDIAQFREIIIRANADGTALRLKDVADIKLGAQSYDVRAKRKGMESVPLMISLAPGANALETVAKVEKKMEELSKSYPVGINHKVIFDTSGFVKGSIKEVVKTLFEAIFLVFIVIFVFLKDWRATLIPSLAVPVSIIGAFAGMMLFNFSINTLTLFGLVLAIGIVVDDAIVVIENVERIMRTEKLGVRDATIKAMQEVTGALVAIVLVLCAVFVPVSFMGGLAGTMYKQFAITIAVSVVISGIVALTLTPALCVIFLNPNAHEKSNAFFEKFDELFEKITNVYVRCVSFCVYKRMTAILIVAGFLAATILMFRATPSSLLPEEDQGVCMVFAILDPAAALSRSESAITAVAQAVAKDKAVDDYMAIAGYNLLGSTCSNSYAAMFVRLKDWSERKGPGLSSADVVKRIFGAGFTIPGALVFAATPPPIVGMSTTGGFEGYIQNFVGASSKDLDAKMKEFIAEASKRPELTGVRTTFNASTPQFSMKVDENKARSLNVSLNDIYLTMASTFGSFYVNDFAKLGRTFKVLVQSKDEYRAYPSCIGDIFVRSSNNAMIPLSAFVKLLPTTGPDVVERFNCFPAAKFSGEPAPGYSSGQALTAIEEVAQKVLGSDYGLAWIGSSYQEKMTGSTSSAALLLGLLVVFLILAAQYERWTLPFSVMLAVPFAMFGAVLAVFLRGFSNDIYFQIAIVTLVGLSAKNAILIVEFAVMLRKSGENLINAAIKAAKLRFRPIVMTSLAFVLGCIPLAISTGAGCASRHSLGTAVVGGMLGATLFAPIFVPLFYVIITGLSELYRGIKNER